MDVKYLIKKYKLQAIEKDGKMMVHTRARVPAKDVAAIKANRDEILKEILNAKEQARKAYEERQAKINASFETEDGGGWGVGPRPNYDFDAAYKKYPQAHAWD